METFGSVVREAREKERISQRKYAELLGVAPSYLSDIELDRRIPEEGKIRKMAAQLCIDVDLLMGLAGRFGKEVETYVKRQPLAIRLFRKIAEADLDEEQLSRVEWLIKEMSDG